MNPGTSGRRTVIAVCGLAVEARIARGPGVRTVAGGGDAARLAVLLERALAGGAAGIISFGIAGGLADELRPGTLLVGRRVVTPQRAWSAHPAWTAALASRLAGARVVDLASGPSIVSDTRAKRALRQATGAAAVDMESHVVAALAEAHGLPFAVLRALADPAARDLPPAACAALRDDGSIDASFVLRSLLRAPGQAPMLARVAADARRALRALSRGRRRLGPGLHYPDLGKLVLDVA